MKIETKTICQVNKRWRCAEKSCIPASSGISFWITKVITEETIIRTQGKMAYNFGYFSNNTEDIWEEETLPGFQEVVLQSTDQPRDRKIYVMYHGTTYTAAVGIITTGFNQSKDGMLGRGVYVSRDVNKAMRYPPRDKTDQVVLKLRVNVGKVKKIDDQYHPMQKTWHENGYDTAWVPAYCGMVKSGLEEDCVWDPKRIKVVGISEASPKHLPQLNYLLKEHAK